MVKKYAVSSVVSQRAAQSQLPDAYSTLTRGNQTLIQTTERRKTHINRVMVKVSHDESHRQQQNRIQSTVRNNNGKKKGTSAKVQWAKWREVGWISIGRGVPDSECCVSKLSPTHWSLSTGVWDLPR